MQDRFKFRVLDTETNKLYPDLDSLSTEESNAHFLLAQDGAIVKKYYNNGEIQLIRMSIYKPIFCSGLKDKNGKLIYEGDILNIRDYSALGYPRSRIGEVKYSFSENYPAFYVATIYGDAKDFTDDMEVLGNIYENPELLEVI